MKRLLRHPRTLAMAGSVLGAYLRFALRTTRWTLHGRDHLGAYLHATPAIFAFWHECLPMMPALWTLALRERAGVCGPRGRMHVLASRHRDGRLLGAVMQGFGLELVYGSTAKGGGQKGGAASVRALAAVLAAGDQVVITPDGPRGPARHIVPGVAQLAALAACPVVPCAARARLRLVLPTWDRMILPLPFGRGVLVCGPPMPVPRDDWPARVPEIANAMTQAADRAEALCRA